MQRVGQHPATAEEKFYKMPEIENLLQRSAMNFRDQKEVLMDIPKKSDAKPLQIYFR